MTLIRPLAGLRPATGRADEVVAPPYDVVSFSEARQRAEGRPNSFLHISRAEIDLPDGTDPYAPEVYACSREHYDRMRREGVLIRDDSPRYYAYRLIMGEHQQTGLVAVASVDDYDSNRVRKHEFTRPAKENDRVAQIDALNAQTGPVLLTYRSDQTVGEILAQASQGDAISDVELDGVRHTLWAITGDEQIATISDRFEAMEAIYIADGHHRSAAASRVCARRRAANPSHSGDEGYNHFLVVMFPDDQMRILDYNRVVRDLNGHSAQSLLEAIAGVAEVSPLEQRQPPAASGQFSLYLAGYGWHRITIRPDQIPHDDPVASLDVSLLQQLILTPLLGIEDPRKDDRIDFVGGIRGLEELERRVNSGEMAVAFACHPTRMEELMSVADSNRVMPPKSTWFEPKLADGLVSHLLD